MCDKICNSRASRWINVVLYAALTVSMLIIPQVCFSQPKAESDQTKPADLQRASKTTGDQLPLSERERELLEIIRDLQERVTRLESQVGRLSPDAGSVARSQTTAMPAERGNSIASNSTTQSSTIKVAGGQQNGILNIPALKMSDITFAGNRGLAPAIKPATKASGTGANAQASQATKKIGAAQSDLVPWNMYEPGSGFTVATTEKGSLNISGYAVARYLNQLPPDRTTFTDHLGRTRPVAPRQDFQFHRVMLYFTGFLYTPKFNYSITLWTVNDTTQVAIVGGLSYAFSKHFIFGAGWNGIPGTRSMQGSHPYWPTYDRVMADEFFRPYFTQGIFADGEILPRLRYKAMLGNNLSQLGIRATQLTRDLAKGVSLVWEPTTGEFGPRGAFGDYENHEKLATRFGFSYTRSREDRFSENELFPDNTTIRLADSLLLFETGSLAEGVTIEKANYQLFATYTGIKYKGLWLQAEGYYRILDRFIADGPLPVGVIRDTGFYVQTAYMVIPRKLELYAGTSYVFSDFGRPKEFLGGANYYWADNRNYRLNLHLIRVDRSPVSSTFGFYLGGLRGTVVAIGGTVLF
jgi:hypothetical protein